MPRAHPISRITPTHTTLVALALLVCVGCSKPKQDYRILPFDQRDELLSRKSIVVEGIVTESSSSIPPTFWDYFWFWIPHGPNVKNRQYHATVVVETVLKGSPGPGTIRLRNYRKMRPDEHALFVDGYGLHMNSVVRLGYAARRGDRLAALEIAPLGNTPQFEEAMRQARSLAERRAASRPAPRTAPKDMTQPLPRPLRRVRYTDRGPTP